MSNPPNVDPFEQHPESEPVKKKLNDTLTLQQIRESIENIMIHIRAEQAPRWGYDKHYVVTVLTELLIELEEKCRNN